MPASRHTREQRSRQLERLESFLRRLGIYGTALVDPDEELSDTWAGLLVWDIARGARSGVVVRCHQVLPNGKWRYCHDTGAVIADVPNRLAVHHELSGCFSGPRQGSRRLTSTT